MLFSLFFTTNRRQDLVLHPMRSIRPNIFAKWENHNKYRSRLVKWACLESSKETWAD